MANQREKNASVQPDWIYPDCTIARYYENWEKERTVGSVRFLKGVIYVTYQDLDIERENANLPHCSEKESFVKLQGEEEGRGHYRLRGAGVEATLHRFESSHTFEGFIKDAHSRGMWRISTNGDGGKF